MMDMLLFAPAGAWLPSLAAALFGLVVGSFLNVVIHRLPILMQREEDNYLAQRQGHPAVHTDRYNLLLPGSTCPHCQHRLGIAENIPLLSFLLQGGRCRSCKTPIRWRYPIVEALTALCSGMAIWHFGSGIAGLASLPFLWLLIALTFIDADTQLLPDDLTLGLLWLGLLFNLGGAFASLHDAVLGAALGYLALWSVYWLFKLATGKEGMGYGDFKLLAALGAWMGWSMLPVIILLSSLVGAIVGVGLILAARLGRQQPMPFGPYLAGAGVLALFYGQRITDYYLNLLL